MKILFLCLANSARSQMAEGWARTILGPSVDVRSVGSKPCGYLHPWAVEAMMESGVDIREQYSKPVTAIPADFLAEVDYVINLCDVATYPAELDSTKLLHWPLPDPAADPEESKPEVFRTIRDKIEARVRTFSQNLPLA